MTGTDHRLVRTQAGVAPAATLHQVRIARATKSTVAAGGRCESTIAPTDIERQTTIAQIVRIGAADLRDLSVKSARLRAAAVRHDRMLTVMVDIKVTLTPNQSSARQELARQYPLSVGAEHNCLWYVGTSSGLAGLIADICTVDIADGVTILPLAGHVSDELLAHALDDLRARGFDVGYQKSAIAMSSMRSE